MVINSEGDFEERGLQTMKVADDEENSKELRRRKKVNTGCFIINGIFLAFTKNFYKGATTLSWPFSCANMF